MFKRGFFRRGRIYSDEGFSVGIADRTRLIYREGRRRMTIAGELGSNGFIVYSSTIGPWDNGAPIDQPTKEIISQRIRAALSSQGLIVDFD